MHEVAQRLLALCRAAIETRGAAHVALSGGNTPRTLFRLMADAEFASLYDWPHIHLWWSDERYVAKDSPELNFNMADTELIRRVPIPPGNVHPTPVERTASDAASEYELEIMHVVGRDAPASAAQMAGTPAFDVILLGLGENGHTASLFPGTLKNLPPGRLVVAHYVPQVLMWRITFTPHLLNAARHVLFLVSGAGKADIVQQVLHGPYQPDVLPAQIVQPAPGDLSWMMDSAAASHLSQR